MRRNELPGNLPHIREANPLVDGVRELQRSRPPNNCRRAMNARSDSRFATGIESLPTLFHARSTDNTTRERRLRIGAMAGIALGEGNTKLRRISTATANF